MEGSDDSDSASSADSTERKQIDKHAACENFTHALIELHLDQILLTAYRLAILCYWACLGGLIGFAEYLRMPPEGVDMSKYSRHVKRALGLDIHDKRLAKLQVPGYS